MKQVKPLPAGTVVRGATGIIGTVERVTGRGNGTGDVAVVLAPDGTTRYRLPLAALDPVRGADGQAVAHTTLTQTDLARYRSATKGRAASDTRDAAPNAIPAEASANGADAATQETNLRIPLVEEELVAEAQPLQRGVVHLHKSVEAQPQSLTLPITTETAQIQRIPADQFDPRQMTDPDVTVIPLVEERLVVRKETVVTEYLVVRKARTETQQTVTETLRREVLTITPEAALPDDPAPLVQMEGDYQMVDQP